LPIRLAAISRHVPIAARTPADHKIASRGPMSKLDKLLRKYRVTKGRKFRLKDHSPADTGSFVADKEKARATLQKDIERLAVLQDKLYAQDRWAILLIFQAMDAAGKDGTIKHVMSGVNPQGCEVYAFKVPSAEDLDHDFLWRTTKSLPERGRIGIFNRSYYEEVLVVRVHPELLERQKIPPRLVTKDVWDDRYQSIADFERHLARNGTVILKFFLNVSRKEQKRRFLERLDEPDKNWKYSAADVKEREHWREYMRAYEDAIRATAAPHAPWYVVPADNKWFTRLVVGAAIVEALESLSLQYPKVGGAQKSELAAARKILESQ
jgi:PPK2 family polyphosphate:nucleotide phosphotransferase